MKMQHLFCFLPPQIPAIEASKRKTEPAIKRAIKVLFQSKLELDQTLLFFTPIQIPNANAAILITKLMYEVQEMYTCKQDFF